MTVRDRLGAIEARANKATDGPWDVGPPGVVYSTGTDAMVQTVATGIGPGQMQDSEFIAAARQDVPALVRALQDVLDLHAESWHDGPICTYCANIDGDDIEPEPYPCPTVRAVTAALGEA